jgi:co-chaperonin GroES (HSP10)
MIRPLSTQVLLSPIPFAPSASLSIVVPEQYRPDEKLFVVVACGSKVPFDIQPGNHVLLDRYVQNPDEFTHEGQRLMVTPWKNVAAVIQQ